MNVFNKFFTVSSFSGKAMQGNRHGVQLCSAEIHINAWKRLSEKYKTLILVVAQIEGGLVDACPRVYFFHRGRSINRCGSGCMALAHVLIDEYGYDCPLTVNTPSGPVDIGKDGSLYYETTFLPITKTHQRYWSSFVNQRLCSAHLVGSAHDYCIIELPGEKQLRRITINGQRLSRMEKRAVIATCVSQHSGYDYAIRYFAPQYDNNEDAATGSANAMLAQFWQQRLRKKIVRAKQLSPEGGFFRIERIGLKQRVMGETRQFTPTASEQALIHDIRSLVHPAGVADL